MKSSWPLRRAPARLRVPTLLGALAAASLLTQSAAHGQQAGSKLEVNVVPIVGGDTDVGIGVGEVGDLARVIPGPRQYLWKVESGGFISGKLQNGGVVFPFQDYYLVFTIPNLTPGQRLRLDIRPAFTNEATLKFYGIGNATPLPPPGTPIDATEYERLHPTLSIEARYRVYEHFYLKLGSVYTQNWLTVRPGTLLAQAQSSPSPTERELIGSFAPHGVELLELEAQYDSRDSDIVTRSGMFISAIGRVSPKITTELPYSYQRLTVEARFYGTPVRRWLTLSFRVVGDTLLGSPPFYELARFDETPALGGGKAVRGVPAQRYYGKVKLFENLEARSEILPFTFHGKHMVLGAAVFLDGGRTWTELGKSEPAFDGTGWGLKYGVGGGLRLQEGQTFVVRADVAWSPDAQPIGAYFAAGEIF